MDAEPVLTRIAEALQRNRLEAVLIGNSGAAVHGAPVTTLDFDFMFRSTPSNLKKLNRIAEELEARLYVPYELSERHEPPMWGFKDAERGLQLEAFGTGLS